MAIDGTWRRPYTMEDVSETGARLTVDGSIEGLPLKDFFCCFRLWETRTGAANSPGSMAIKLASFSSSRATRGKNPKEAVRHFPPATGEVCSRIGKLWLVVATFGVWNLISPVTEEDIGGIYQQANPKVSIKT
jgi:hypothetical protein